MNIFNKTQNLKQNDNTAPQKTTLELLKEKSNGAVSSIRAIITSLKECNEEIIAAKESNEQKIADITSENKLYDSMQADNGKVIANFESLLK